ncbi:MAG: hypothetical protein U0822_23665 [Anaerolineae bacterium]
MRLSRFLRLFLAAVVALTGLSLVVSVFVVSAQTSGGDTQTVTVPAKGSATVNVKAFCLEYGKPFPATFPTSLGNKTADPQVVNILRYAVSQGFTETNPYQVQLALWRQTSGEWKSTDNALAQQIYTAGTQASNAQAAPANGQTLVQAAGANNVQVTATSWTPLPAEPEQNPWAGQGTLQITNPGSSAATITVPLGIVVSGGGTDQDVIMYATSSNALSGSQQVAQVTPAATSASGAGAAAQATQAATATLKTAAATATPQAVATASSGAGAAAATPTARPTAARAPLPNTGGEPAGDSSFLVILGALLLLSGLGLALYRPAVRRS